MSTVRWAGAGFQSKRLPRARGGWRCAVSQQRCLFREPFCRSIIIGQPFFLNCSSHRRHVPTTTFSPVAEHRSCVTRKVACCRCPTHQPPSSPLSLLTQQLTPIPCSTYPSPHGPFVDPVGCPVSRPCRPHSGRDYAQGG